ncbi:MAG: endolytic transglycosylase MltG [Porticoccaceae bacterium]|nr:endolytic transglycosylase MltG [Porticoccaceae bacterium]MDG1311694.1 endolytic transglycosylase MltG [Porticoccaceae bacterium]
MNKALLRLLLISLLLLTAAGASLYVYVQYHLDQPVTLAEAVEEEAQPRLMWTVEKGSNLGQVNRKLHSQGIVSRPKLMARYANFSGRTAIQAGSYWIEADDNARSLLDKFNRGDVIRYQITFPEGWSFKQWLAHLELRQVPQFELIAQLSVDELLALANIELDHPEGWFFPDTYSYSATDSVLDILGQAHRQMRAVLQKAWQVRGPGLPYKSAYEALIMASIIEKETGLATEREEIAGVFVRRLLRNMRLQTDPTVIYGMADSYKGNIRRVHLKQRTPYNTYMIKGLPPTPIAMPSAAAIDAALHPLPGSSLYFVARGDGGHYFSDSLEEHLRAVQQYQIKHRAQNYQSAPQQ